MAQQEILRFYEKCYRECQTKCMELEKEDKLHSEEWWNYFEGIKFNFEQICKLHKEGGVLMSQYLIEEIDAKYIRITYCIGLKIKHDIVDRKTNKIVASY